MSKKDHEDVRVFEVTYYENKRPVRVYVEVDSHDFGCEGPRAGTRERSNPRVRPKRIEGS
jgi:hypothetical protein